MMALARKSAVGWIVENKEWLFSGLGISVICFFAWLFKSKPPRTEGVDLSVTALTCQLQQKMGEVAGLEQENNQLKEAAATARHIGALVYLHDTEKTLNAYRQAVGLDPNDPDGWNMLGYLLKRIGDLDQARKAFEKVLSLGNLSAVAKDRGDKAKACQYWAQSKALYEEIGIPHMVERVGGWMAELGC